MRRDALLAAAFVIVSAGCASAGASTNGGAAAIAPANSVSFVVSDTNFGSSKWHGLGKAFSAQLPPEVRKLADGREVDVATLPGKKTVAFVKGDVKAAHTRKFGEWTAVANDEATLDAVTKAKAHLADVPRYSEAMNALPSDALVRVYADSDEALRLFSAIPGQIEARLLPPGARYRFTTKAMPRTAATFGILELRWLAASLTSHGDGLKLETFAPRGDLVANGPPRFAVQPIQPYVSALADEIPAGVVGVVDFQLPAGAFELLQQVPKPLSDLFGKDTALPTELDAVLGGETALYVRPGLPTPEITLVTQPADTDQALQTLDSLLRASPALGKTRLYRAVIGGQLVVSTTQSGIDAFRAGGTKLSGDRSFQDAKKAAGMPDRTTGFAYADERGLPLLALAGVPVPKDLPPLHRFVAYGADDQDRSTLTALLDVG